MEESNEASSRVCVSVRVRPCLGGQEKSRFFEVLSNNGNTQTIQVGPKQFTFDNVFDDGVPQSLVFGQVGQPIVSNVVKGLHGTICAYGATGSGKTHTMLGQDLTLSDTLPQSGLSSLPSSRSVGNKKVDAGIPMSREATKPTAEEGLAPRCIRLLFDTLVEKSETENMEFEISVSLLEIYMEKVRDLLRLENDDQAANLKIREDESGIAFVEHLTKWPAVSASQAVAYLRFGQMSRVVSKTKSNTQSSRSHLLFFVDVTQHFRQSSVTNISRLTIADLAGSEKQSKTCSEGLTLEEAKKINTSLLAFGKVVHALTSPPGSFPPFRDSALTRVLQGSLKGTSTMAFVCTIASDFQEQNETMTTLRFGQRLKLIKVDAKINEVRSVSFLEKLIKERDSEILKLSETIAKMEREISNRNVSRARTIETNSSKTAETSEDDVLIGKGTREEFSENGEATEDEELITYSGVSRPESEFQSLKQLPPDFETGEEDSSALIRVYASFNQLKKVMWQLMGVHHRITLENRILQRNNKRIKSLLKMSEGRCEKYARILTNSFDESL